MGLGDTVEFTHVALGLVPETFDTTDVILTVCKELGKIDPEMMEVRHIQSVIALPAFRVDD